MWLVGVVGDHPCPSRYFETVFNASGLQALVAQYGDWFSYTKNPRAKIFQRDQSLVEDMDAMVRLMRWVSIPQACMYGEPLLHDSTTEPCHQPALVCRWGPARYHPWGVPFSWEVEMPAQNPGWS